MQLRNSRTPSPFENSTMHQIAQHPPGRTSPYQHSEPENEEIENFFNPINISNSSGRDSANCIPIELQVTNLDQNMEPKEIKRVLSSIFMEHVMVKKSILCRIQYKNYKRERYLFFFLVFNFVQK